MDDMRGGVTKAVMRMTFKVSENSDKNSYSRKNSLKLSNYAQNFFSDLQTNVRRVVTLLKIASHLS